MARTQSPDSRSPIGQLVLRNLPREIQLAIRRKALVEDLSREEAVVELLRDAELARILKSDEFDDHEPF